MARHKQEVRRPPMMFKWKDSPVLFEDDILDTRAVRVSTREHGELGYIWEEPNGSYSAKVGSNTARHIGNSAVAIRWVLENQPS